jgi:hypothetical protein
VTIIPIASIWAEIITLFLGSVPFPFFNPCRLPILLTEISSVKGSHACLITLRIGDSKPERPETDNISLSKSSKSVIENLSSLYQNYGSSVGGISVLVNVGAMVSVGDGVNVGVRVWVAVLDGVAVGVSVPVWVEVGVTVSVNVM